MLQYLIESSLLDGDTFLQYLPSVTAAAAICLANLMLGSSEPWVRDDALCHCPVYLLYVDKMWLYYSM